MHSVSIKWHSQKSACYRRHSSSLVSLDVLVSEGGRGDKATLPLWFNKFYLQTHKQSKLKVNLMQVFSSTEVIRVQILRYRWLWLHSPAAHLSPCVLLHGCNSLRQSYRRFIFFTFQWEGTLSSTLGPSRSSLLLSSHLRGWKHFPQSALSSDDVCCHQEDQAWPIEWRFYDWGPPVSSTSSCSPLSLSLKDFPKVLILKLWRSNLTSQRTQTILLCSLQPSQVFEATFFLSFSNHVDVKKEKKKKGQFKTVSQIVDHNLKVDHVAVWLGRSFVGNKNKIPGLNF